MSRDNEIEYYRRRAEEEVERASNATEPSVVAVHYAMAELYLARLPERKDELPAVPPEEGPGTST